MIQYYSVKQKHTSYEHGSRDWKGHSRNYLKIIRIHHQGPHSNVYNIVLNLKQLYSLVPFSSSVLLLFFK